MLTSLNEQNQSPPSDGLCHHSVGNTILNRPLRLYFLGEVRKRGKYEFYKYDYYFGVPIGAPFLYLALL